MAISRPTKRNASPSRDDQPSERPSKRLRNSSRTNIATSDSQETGKAIRSTREPTVKTKKGGLIKAKPNLFNTLPIDVFAKIAAYLSPEDLLAMARASKSLKILLISKSSRAVWAAAERAVDIPTCPSDLSCPQYASLVFDNFCMACRSATRKTQRDIRMRYRLCAKCEKTELIDVFAYLDHNLTNLTMAIPARLYQNGMPKYYKPAFIAVKQHFISLPDEQTKSAFLTSKRLELALLSDHAEKVEAWLDARQKMKEEATQDVVTRRLDAIHRRLSELGYTQDDFPIRGDEDYKKWDSLTTQPRELTGKIWSSIRPQLEGIILLRRKRDSERVHRACLENREGQLRGLASEILSTPQGTDCFYSFEELLRLPTVVDYLQADGLDSTLSEADRQVIKNKMLERGALQKRKVVEKLESRMMEALSSHKLLAPNFKLDEDHRSILDYKYAFFMDNPQYEWGCRTFDSVLGRFREATSSSYKKGYPRSANYKQLMENIIPNVRASATAQKLSNAFGVGDLTMQKLDALGVVFTCKLCNGNGSHISQPLQFRWSALVKHFYENSKSSSMTNFSKSHPDHTLEDKVIGKCVTCLQKAKAKLNPQS